MATELMKNIINSIQNNKVPAPYGPLDITTVEKAEIIQKSEPIPEDFFIDSQILSDPIVVAVILFFILS